MILTVDTAIMVEAILVLVVLATVLIGRLLWKTGGEFMPETMKVIYRMVMEWFAKIGWGENTGAKRLDSEEYPNRKEAS